MFSNMNESQSIEYQLRSLLALVDRLFFCFFLIKSVCECLDDNDCIGYLNHWDKKLPNLDVVDDYRNEKREILARQGKQFPFSFGDVKF